jgi:hypothetical protein
MIASLWTLWAIITAQCAVNMVRDHRDRSRAQRVIDRRLVARYRKEP